MKFEVNSMGLCNFQEGSTIFKIEIKKLLTSFKIAQLVGIGLGYKWFSTIFKLSPPPRTEGAIHPSPIPTGWVILNDIDLSYNFTIKKDICVIL